VRPPMNGEAALFMKQRLIMLNAQTRPYRHGHIYLEVVKTKRPHVGKGRETKAIRPKMMGWS